MARPFEEFRSTTKPKPNYLGNFLQGLWTGFVTISGLGVIALAVMTWNERAAFSQAAEARKELLAVPDEVVAKRPRENDLTKELVAQWKARGIRCTDQHRTADGSFVDVLTETRAYEAEWPEKWKESIGQAVFYAAAENRKPGVILYMTDDPRDRTFYLRCLTVCAKLDIELIAWKWEEGR